MDAIPLPALPSELYYIILVLALFVVPNALQRFRIPTAIAALALGAAVGMGLGWFRQDGTIHLLATFGIVALFLLAGLEVDFAELQRHARLLTRHLAMRVAILAVTAALAMKVFALDLRPALLLALALLTPSVGFILSSLPRLGLSPAESLQVKLQAISSELLALGLLFVCVQSVSAERLIINGAALLGIIAILPVAFWLFVRHLLPHAPRTEFAFLLIIAIACAWATRALDAYYLLGAFLAGLVAVRTSRLLPELVSPRLLHALELFAAFFIPFYFFAAGLDLEIADFSPWAMVIGGALVAVCVPLRIAQVVALRDGPAGEPLAPGLRIAVALLPTLVFTLVLARILRDRFGISHDLYGGLIIYTLVNSLIPGFFLKAPADYSAPQVRSGLPRGFDGAPPPAGDAVASGSVPAEAHDAQR